MSWWQKNENGIALVEALVAVAMLGLATLVVSSIIGSAIDATRSSRDYLVAQNLATEGVEIVRNIRDSNWLLHPERPECWLNIVPAAEANCNELASITVDGVYTPAFSERWILEVVDGNVGLNLAENLNQIDSQVPYLINIEEGRYVQGAVGGDPSRFYRSIQAVDLQLDPNDPAAANATFEVRVEWLDGARPRSVVRRFTIFNYFQ